MTAAIAQPAHVASVPKTVASSDARKRRREIIANQRSVCPDAVLSAISDMLPDIVADAAAAAASRSSVPLSDLEVPEAKHRRVSLSPGSPTATATATDMACRSPAPIVTVAAPSPSPAATASAASSEAKKAKKPQMKYDPDEPMSKEEAAVWRRDQRRKRNRESAAASRQRQRDRITELEAEAEEWKAKVGEIMKRIHQLEQLKASSGSHAGAAVKSAQSVDIQVVDSESKFVSPPASPVHSASFVNSPVVGATATASPEPVIPSFSSFARAGVGQVSPMESSDSNSAIVGPSEGSKQKHQQPSLKMITRHATS